MTSRPVYKRMGFASRAPTIRTESDELADQLFKVPKPAAAVALKQAVNVPSDDDYVFPDVESRKKAPLEPKRDRRKASKTPSLFGHSEEESDAHDANIPQASDDEVASVKSKATGRSSSIFSKVSKGSRKRSPKKRKLRTPSVDDDGESVPETVRKERGKRRKEPVASSYDPNEDPQYLAFQQEMEELKAHPLQVQDEVEYWNELEENLHREQQKQVSEIKLIDAEKADQSNNKDRKKLLLSKKKRDRLTRISRPISPPKVDGDDVHIWVTEPETSTPILQKRKTFRSPKLSAIKDLSPFSTLKKPRISSRKRFSGVKEGADLTGSSSSEIPATIVEARLESRKTLDFSPEEEDEGEQKSPEKTAEKKRVSSHQPEVGGAATRQSENSKGHPVSTVKSIASSSFRKDTESVFEKSDSPVTEIQSSDLELQKRPNFSLSAIQSPEDIQKRGRHPQEGLSRDSVLPKESSRRTRTSVVSNIASASRREDFELKFPESDLQSRPRTRQSSDLSSRPSTAQSFQVPRKPSQSERLSKESAQIRPSTKEAPLLSSLLKKQATGSQHPTQSIPEPQSDPWTDEQSPRPSSLKLAGNRSGDATLLSQASSSGSTSRIPSAIPCTPNSTIHSARRYRESIGVFSPAVLSAEDRASLSLTRAHRKSIVVNARKGTFDLILEICVPNKVIPTSHILGNDYKDLMQVGEGSYADVYRAVKNGEEIVMKIIPVGGYYQNQEKQTTFDEILSEVLISRELTLSLLDENSKTFYAPVFVKTHFVKVARGEYPEEFSQRHDSYARLNEANALNQHPMAYAEYQQYVIIGLSNGGEPLDSYPLTYFKEAKSVFQQVALGLAVAEKRLEFEHRDAHISNILIQHTTKEYIKFVCDGIVYQVPSHGVHVTIIDWTLSRMKKGKQIVYKDLKDDELIFEGSGDKQFDVYRWMRDENGHDWEAFVPKTNVFWLNYLQDKLIRGKNIQEEPDDPTSLKELKALSRVFKKFGSATELVEKTKWFQNCICKI